LESITHTRGRGATLSDRCGSRSLTFPQSIRTHWRSRPFLDRRRIWAAPCPVNARTDYPVVADALERTACRHHRDRRAAVRYFQPPQKIGYMLLRGRRRDPQGFSDLRVRRTLRDERDDLPSPRRERERA